MPNLDHFIPERKLWKETKSAANPIVNVKFNVITTQNYLMLFSKKAHDYLTGNKSQRLINYESISGE